MTDTMERWMAYKKKLIEVALPLEAINKASAKGEIDSTRPSEHVASLVGTAAACGGVSGVLLSNG